MAMIVVTTPTGNIGSQIVRELVLAGETVRVVVRDPAKLPSEVRSQVGVVQGSLDDAAVMLRALEGAESLLLVVPADFAARDVVAHYLRFTQPACRAVVHHRVQRVVSVSGIGRNVPVAAGPVTASFAKDLEIERTGVAFRALWCPGFMENMLRNVPTLKRAGTFSAPTRSDVKAPRVAARDIAASGVRLLRDRSWTGQGGEAVLGPEDLSPDEQAAIMTEVLGKPIRFLPISSEAYIAQLVQFGASVEFAQGLVDMLVAKDDGLDNSEPRTSDNTTPTSFRQWCQEVLKPAVLA
jgi:uncharacterized protein YbjT (DUF2867 family)